MVARATAGVWEAARPVFDPGIDNQTIGNEIVVLPDGTLVDVFDLIGMASSTTPTARATAIRSTDHGDTWSAPIDIAAMNPDDVFDPRTMQPIRTGDVLPQVAVDAAGTLYATWQDTVAGNQAVVVTTSRDGGVTWSPPVRANGEPSALAFTPSIAASGTTVGVIYTDNRDSVPSDPVFRVTSWLATSSDGGATWTDEPLTGPYDLSTANLGGFYFLGDYQGLAAVAGGFVPFFVVAVDATDPTDVYAKPN
jgi:hypothetical protein